MENKGMSDKEIILEILEIYREWDYLYGNGDMGIDVNVYYFLKTRLYIENEITECLEDDIEMVKNDNYILKKMIQVELIYKNKIIFCENFSNSSEFSYWIRGINIVLPKRLRNKYFNKYLKLIWRSK